MHFLNTNREFIAQHNFCSVCSTYVLLTFYTVSTIHDVEAAGGLLLWLLLVVTDYDSFIGAHLNRICYTCFLHICDYNLVLSFIVFLDTAHVRIIKGEN